MTAIRGGKSLKTDLNLLDGFFKKEEDLLKKLVYFLIFLLSLQNFSKT
jgi:hypothetical protein